MQKVRDKHPRHVPCLVHLPDETELKLLMEPESTVSFVMHSARARWKNKPSSPSDTYFMFSGEHLCMGATRVESLDVAKPEAVEFRMLKECTFG